MYVHALSRASVHVLLQSSLLILLCVYLSLHVLPRAFLRVTLLESTLMVAVLHVCPLFCPTQSCVGDLAMTIGQFVSTSRSLLGICCIITWNFRNVAPCSGLVKNSVYISPVGQYFRDKPPLSISSLIKKYRTWM